MIVNESRIGRRLVVLLHRGEEVSATLRRLCERENVRSAWVRGRGVLEWAEITEWDSAREAYRKARRIEGPLGAAALEGNVSIRLGPVDLQLSVVVTRHSERGIETLAGTLVAASALGLELVVDTFEDVRLERMEDASSGLTLWKGEYVPGVAARRAEVETFEAPPVAIDPSARGPVALPPRAARPDETEPDDPEEPAKAAGISWADVAAASKSPPEPGPLPAGKARRAEAVAALDEPYPEKGDFIDHRQFGLCRVEGDDDQGGLRIRLPSGARKVIKLDFMEVLPARVEGDRRVFPVRPRKR